MESGTNNASTGSIDTENINEIQNYLDSFNKEIQTGNNGPVQQDVRTSSTGAAPSKLSSNAENKSEEEQQPAATVNSATEPVPTTFYVTAESTDGSQQINQYQTFENEDQEQEQYNSSGEQVTFYGAAQDADEHATYYVAADEANQSQSSFTETYASGDAESQPSESEKPAEAVENGLQQIVIAASQSESVSSNTISSHDPVETVDAEASEISVSIPASMDSVGCSQDEVSMETNETLSTSQNEQQVVRMIVKQPDGTEHEQQIPVSALRAATSGSQTSSTGTTLVTADGQEITIGPAATSGSGGSALVTADGQELTIGNDETLQMVANLAQQSANNGEGSQVILNSNNAYQTVTIVPSSDDNNQGEVSYVLIVSQDDGKDGNKDNVDMSVYDFTEGAGDKGAITLHEATPEEANDIIAFTTKVSQKKSQVVSQATHMCNYCNYTSSKRYLLSRHMKSHSEERPHKCSVCERGFKTLASLQNHVNTHTGTRPHQCKECASAFTTSGELVRHVRYKHTHEKPHRCSECDYASVELSKLKRHVRCHTGERPYQCPHCTYASPDTYKLKRHLRIHTGEKPYECDDCGAKFTQSNSLKAHRLIHTGNKPIFRCELCPTTCGRKTDLRIHVQKLHTAEKPLKCRRCNKIFPDRYTYKIHSKTHEGEKCFKCDLCNYASISQRHLESHMLIHTDQKPYLCEFCDQSFRQKQLLKRHKNLYHNPTYVPPTPKDKLHECPNCAKPFRHKGNLMRHMAIHDPDATPQEKANAVRYGGQAIAVKQNVQISVDEMGQVHSMPISSSVPDENNDGQVVVFEVIQLQDPEDDNQDVTGLDDQEASNMSTDDVVNSVTTINNDTSTATVAESESSQLELAETDLEVMKKRTTVTSNMDDDFEWNPTSDSEKDQLQGNADIDDSLIASKIEPVVVNDEEVVQQREEQKQKDVEECFGFNDDAMDADEECEDGFLGHSPTNKTTSKIIDTAESTITASFEPPIDPSRQQQAMMDEQAMQEIAEVVGDNGAPSAFIVTQGPSGTSETAIQLLAAIQDQSHSQ